MKLGTNSAKALILIGMAFLFSFVYIVLQVQEASSGQATLTVPASISPTSTLLPDDYEQRREEAADYWLQNVHKWPVPPTPSPEPPYITPTPEAYPFSTVEPTAIVPNATATVSPSTTVDAFNEVLPASQQSQDRISPGVSSNRMNLPIILKRIIEIRVFVVAYLDEPVGRDEFDQLLANIVADLTEGSRWHGIGAPSVNYTISTLSKTTATTPSNSFGNLSYAAVFSTFRLCDKIRNGEIDQVWLFNPGNVYNPVEFAVNGDDYGFFNTLVDLPNCGKSRPMFTFVYANLLEGEYHPAYSYQAVHSYSHYIEAMFWMRKQRDRLYCDFLAANGRKPSHVETDEREFPSQCAGGFARSNQYGFTSLALTSSGLSTSVIGDVHYPPNTVVATLDTRYNYERATTVSSIADRWNWGQNPPTTNVSCKTWGGCTDGTAGQCSVNSFSCPRRRYLIWWLQHIPTDDSDSIDRNGRERETWWTYLLQ